MPNRKTLNKTYLTAILLVSLVVVSTISFKSHEDQSYVRFYKSSVNDFSLAQNSLLNFIKKQDVSTEAGKQNIKFQIANARLKLKAIDFWLRYLEPVVYHKLNGPLAVEWETEVFEKFEPPYRREGAGLSLAELYLDEKQVNKDSLLNLVNASLQATGIYLSDSISSELNRHDHFFLANRLFILNLSSIYTTGFECPNKDNIIPELESMLASVYDIYTQYNESYASYPVTREYLSLYSRAVSFVKLQNHDPEKFDHFVFIRDYVNPLFAMNQKMIRDYHVISNNFNDFSLDNNCNSIFNKSLYKGQNAKGVFIAVEDEAMLADIKKIGKLLFYDPILSGNNKRSCVSCHKPTEYFTDTAVATTLQFDGQQSLPRNTPTLVNVLYQHLIMLDGQHISLMNQAKAVIGNPIEMCGGGEKEVLKKIRSCSEYENAFKRFVKLTPNSPKISIDHIVSALILYYSDFSNYYAPFDDAMNDRKNLNAACEKGFNIFMSKAQCGTCHFVPQFTGVRPPYISTEFEVVGVPFDTTFKKLSPDSGRAKVNPSPQTMNAFRTGSLRNIEHTKPYMHNGIFNTLDEVIDFYDAGGGSGKGLAVSNQTLSADSLKLTKNEKAQLKAFIGSLNENIKFDSPPEALPASKDKNLQSRKVGGEY